MLKGQKTGMEGKDGEGCFLPPLNPSPQELAAITNKMFPGEMYNKLTRLVFISCWRIECVNKEKRVVF